MYVCICIYLILIDHTGDEYVCQLFCPAGLTLRHFTVRNKVPPQMTCTMGFGDGITMNHIPSGKLT